MIVRRVTMVAADREERVLGYPPTGELAYSTVANAPTEQGRTSLSVASGHGAPGNSRQLNMRAHQYRGRLRRYSIDNKQDDTDPFRDEGHIAQ